MELTPFHHFISFVQCDDLIRELDQKRGQLQKNLNNLAIEFDIEKNKLEQVRLAERTLHKELDAAELECSAMLQAKKSSEQKLERAVNPKEYNSAHSEIARMTALLDPLEAKIMTLWENLERAQEFTKTIEHAYNQREIACQAQVKELQKNLEEHDLKIRQLQEASLQKRALVRPEWIAKFDLLKEQVPNPVVTLNAGGCVGCFNKMPAQLVIRLQRHELVNCPFCYRLLYVE